MVDPDLKDAVWQVLEDYAKRGQGAPVHSDLVMRKFPMVNEQELLNAIGELIADGSVTAKSASVDAYGNPKSFHIRVRGVDERPGGQSKPPRGGVGEFGVGFGDTTAASSRRATEEPPPPRKPAPDIRDSKIDVGFGVDEPPRKTPPDERQDRVNVSTGQKRPAHESMQEEAERNFEEELASFFGELQMASISDEDAKKELTDQLMMVMAMFQAGEVNSFSMPINKLAALKGRVQRIVPDLAKDYILLVQTAVRAWLGKA